ncbi:UNVERIFIED_CONTAM: hypothetical protein GTU68_061327 [Idotea baltica]|nr:hypothetical protein [Idotea baltica]
MEELKLDVEELKRDQRSARNCADLLKKGDTESGVRTVYPFGYYKNISFSVFCDQNTDGGGWTVFQRRADLPQREDFFRGWVDYQLGFGNLTGEFWLGLDNIHALVSSTHMELRIELEDFDGEKRWAKYDNFNIGDSAGKYRLTIGNYDGDAGNSLSRHDGQAFSTKDQDNDTNDHRNCAEVYQGAWWYFGGGGCHNTNLNGLPKIGKDPPFRNGIHWYHFRGGS